MICAQQPELDFDFHRDIFPQIQKLIADTYKAAFHKIDPQRLHNTFEVRSGALSLHNFNFLNLPFCSSSSVTIS